MRDQVSREGQEAILSGHKPDERRDCPAANPWAKSETRPNLDTLVRLVSAKCMSAKDGRRGRAGLGAIRMWLRTALRSIITTPNTGVSIITARNTGGLDHNRAEYR